MMLETPSTGTIVIKTAIRIWIEMDGNAFMEFLAEGR